MLEEGDKETLRENEGGFTRANRIQVIMQVARSKDMCQVNSSNCLADTAPEAEPEPAQVTATTAPDEEAEPEPEPEAEPVPYPRRRRAPIRNADPHRLNQFKQKLLEMESQQQQRNNRRGARPSVGYLLFQYQSELTRRHAEPTRLSRTKIHIIDGLVSHTIRHLKNCSVEELQACKRELVYKEQLRDQLKWSMKRRRMATTRSSSGSRGSSPAPMAKSPRTPPKPRPQGEDQTSKVSLFGPEIFV
ncbi:uncharacterized protein [Drosophila pseudoobscura]|uniref:Uncharacterized protein n=1 Tax=Drosophila pseudoobscura pseudoobscura TaxID=46245 RepID=A0A6I8UB53_DROPS|nr:uncharacterized protein LOC4812081 [Drosophila pseudoobscura]